MTTTKKKKNQPRREEEENNANLRRTTNRSRRRRLRSTLLLLVGGTDRRQNTGRTKKEGTRMQEVRTNDEEGTEAHTKTMTTQTTKTTKPPCDAHNQNQTPAVLTQIQEPTQIRPNMPQTLSASATPRSWRLSRNAFARATRNERKRWEEEEGRKKSSKPFWTTKRRQNRRRNRTILK